MNNIKEYLPLINKIIDWAQKNNKKVQTLTKKDLKEAMRSRASNQ